MATLLPAVHRLAVALALLLLAAPLASAQGATEDATRPSVPVAFYGHVFAFGYDFPMPTNTQFPYGEDNLGLGSFDWCTSHFWMNGPTAVPDTSRNCETDANNKLVLFSTAGPVDIGTRDEFFGGDQYVQFHNERGSTKDILLDRSKSATATVFMSLDLHAWSVGQGLIVADPFGPVFPADADATYCAHPDPPDVGCVYPYWGWDPAQWPDWVVKASLYYSVFGDYGSGASDQIPIREAIESGSATLVAEGQVGPQTLTNGLPGNPNVHRFDIDLGAPQVDRIPKEANFFLVYNFYSQNGDQQLSAQHWRIWTGEFFPPSFVLPTKNAFDVELVVPVFLHGKLVIVGILNTPWGSYDVKPEATTLVVTDASGKVVEPRALETVSEYKFSHGAHYNPVNVSYIWNYQSDRLAPGTYTATISGENQQGTGKSSCSATFEIRANGRPGNVEVGRCGQVSEQAQTTAPAAGASEGVPTDAERRLVAVNLPYGLGADYLAQSADVAPAPASGAGLLAAPAALVLAMLGVALRRRWNA